MKTSILISTITAALLAGTSIVAAQNEPKQEPKAAPNAQMNKDQSKPGAVKKSEPAKKSETTGQGGQAPAGAQKSEPAKEPAKKSEPAKKDQTTGQGSQPGGQMAPPSRNGQQGAQPRQAPGSQPSQGAQAPSSSGAAGASVNLTTEQKTQIRQSVLQSRSAPRVASPTFSITVGTVVPRTVTLVAVPEPLFRINASWRGYRYFIVGDQIIIVDRNFRIVAILTV